MLTGAGTNQVPLALSKTLLVSHRRKSADAAVLLRSCDTLPSLLGYYGKPRMTRDLDFVVALMARHVDALVSAFSTDFYIDEDAVRSAIKSQRMFNLMHLDSAIKVDLIVRKNSEYRHAEFERRKSVDFAGISTWITSREDLILSKLVWARDTDSEMQLRDVRTLIDESVDWPYLKDWAAKLGVAAKLEEFSK